MVKILTSFIVLAVVISGGLIVIYNSHIEKSKEAKPAQSENSKFSMLEHLFARDIQNASYILAVDENWRGSTYFNTARKEKEVHFYDAIGHITCAYRIRSGRLEAVHFDPPAKSFDALTYVPFVLDGKNIHVTSGSIFELQPGRRSIRLNLQLL